MVWVHAIESFAIVAMVGCFKPSLTAGLPCGAEDWCPSPQKCIDGVCAGTQAMGGDAGDDGGGAGMPEANLAFTSSMAIQPGTSSNAAILQSADAMCNTLGQKLRSGTYMAWLGVDANDAATRIASHTMGKPGWVRSDGRPFTTSLMDLMAGTIYYPLRLDDNGTDVVTLSALPAVVTELPATGCDGGGVEVIRIGLATGNEPAWRSFDAYNCATTMNLWLYCFEVDRSIAVAPPMLDATLPLGFESPIGHPIDAGLAALDDACQADGDAAGFAPRQFRALVAMSNATAKSRFPNGSKPWTRLDGVVFAPASLAKFDAPLSIVPASPAAELPSQVVFGGGDLTSMATSNCNDWSSSTGSAIAGFSALSDVRGFDLSGTDCSAPARLYCLEVP